MTRAFCTLEFIILKSHIVENIRVMDDLKIIDISIPGDELNGKS